MAQNTQQQPSQTPEDLEQEARALGKKIGLLLQTSGLPEDFKQAVLTALPEMTPEEIDKLVQHLENEVAMGQLDEQALKQNLTSIKQKYDTQQKKLADDAMSELDELEKEIK